MPNPLIKTYKINEVDGTGTISWARAGDELSKVWGGTKEDGYSGIWTPGQGKTYAVGEHCYCSQCSASYLHPKFDEPSLPINYVGDSTRHNPDPNEHARSALMSGGSQVFNQVCYHPLDHIEREKFKYFWSPYRTGRFVKDSLGDSACNFSSLSLTKLPFRGGSTIYWTLLYRTPLSKILANIKQSPLKDNASVEALYFDTIGSDTRKRSVGGALGWLFNNFLLPTAFIDQLEVIVPAVITAQNEGIPILIRTSPKEGKHVLAFAKSFFKSVVEVGESNVKAGRVYYQLSGFKLQEKMMDSISGLPHLRGRVSGLRRQVDLDRPSPGLTTINI
jgi:hypothetical protein